MKGLGLLAHICQLLLKRRTVEMPGKMKDADPTLRSVVSISNNKVNTSLVSGWFQSTVARLKTRERLLVKDA
jgi:hypothetical protein